MSNTYHHQLNIPVKFLPVFPDDAPVISMYDKSLINKEFIDWLASLQIEIGKAELFHLKANPINEGDYNKLPIHLDDDNFDNHVKINFVYCDTPSKMNWFVCKDASKLKCLKTPTGTDYILAEEEDCELVFSAQVGQPSLVNVGMLHSISAVESERHCFSFPLIKDGKPLCWEQAKEIFKEYVSLV